MSVIYGRLSAIRDYWMARDQNARVEVRITDLDEILRELARTMPDLVEQAQSLVAAFSRGHDAGWQSATAHHTAQQPASMMFPKQVSGT